MARSFYMDLFTTEPHPDVDQVLKAIPARIHQVTNEALCKPCSNEEIKEALFQMGPTKALFYQKHWDLIKGDICQAVRNILEGDDIPLGLCDTTIILVPKMS